MKKLWVSFASCLCTILFLAFSVTFVQAEEVKKSETNVGVQIEQSDVQKEVSKPPLINGGNNTPDQRLLPKTGELLSSLIVVLLGLSLFIFGLGVMSIKQLYQTTSWEV